MTVRKILSFTVFFFLIVLGLKSQVRTEQDSSMIEFSAINQQDIFLDSMLTRWYVKKSLVNQFDESSDTSSILIDIPDSIYIDRLSKIMSPIEMTYNEDVLNWIRIYIKKNRRTPTIIGLMEYYGPIFEEVLDANGLPLEFKYLPVIESALNPRALSRAGASGLWQFMYSTGRMYGLENNSFVDARRDPIQATESAAHFLNDLYAMYHDWTLVLAAYNCGPGNVNKAIKRAKQKTDFWEIYQYLPRETRGYVPAFIAATYTMNYYAEHNIHPVKVEMNMQTDTVMINQKLHFAQISEVLDIPIEELRELNPQYKKDIIPAHIRSYSLRLPIESTMKFIELEDSIYTYKDSIYLGKSKYVIADNSVSKNKTTNSSYSTSHSGSSKKYSSKSYADSQRDNYEAPSTKGKQKLTYIVKEGDTYGFIASWYNVNVSDLKYWNNAYSNRLKIGQTLNVYVPIKKLSYYQPVNALTFAQKQARKGTISTTSAASSSTASSSNSDTVSADPSSNSTYVWHKIEKGENLWLIAQKYPGVSDKDLKALNRLSSSELKNLKAGQYIKIKKK